MKQVKVKKIKKIPKYRLGIPDVPPVNTGQTGTTGQTGNAGTSVLGTLYGSYTPQLGASFPQLYMSSPQLDVSSAGAARNAGTSGADFATSATPYMDAIGTGVDLINVATSGQKPTVASAAGSALKGASAGMTFGPVGAAIGAAAGLLAGTAGGRAKFDPSKLSATGDIANAVSKNTGWIGGLFGADRNKLLRDAAQWQNSLVATELTSNLRAEWANDPRNQIETQPVTVAEGGIMRKPVDALVSKGELIYNPETKQLSKVPGSKGKPNKADDVYAKLYEGDVVISNSPTMLMANGKTPALNLEKLVDRKPREQEIHTDGFRARTPRMYKSDTLGAREAIIKKVVNWQEANKTEPQLYAMYALGKDGVEEEPEKTSKWSDKAEWWTENVALPAIVNWFNRATYDPYGFSGNAYIPVEDRITGRAISDAYLSYADPNLGTSIDSGFTYADWTKGGKTNTAINKAVEQSVKKQTSDLTQEPVSTAYSTTTTSEEPVKKPVSTLSSATTRINPYGYNKNISEFAHWDKEKNDYTQEYKDWVNSLTEKDIKDIYNGVYGDMSTYLGKNKGYVPTLAEAKRLMTDRKYGDWHKMAQTVKERMIVEDRITGRAIKVPPILSKEVLDKTTPKGEIPTFDKPFNLLNLLHQPQVRQGDGSGNKQKSFDWNKFGDRLYEAASILTPLLDREKAEPVQYQTPIAKYRPTSVNVDPQLRAANESYAMARYNQANISPNTGAGMAYGLQAATNRAKQMSDIYNWQTNAQNELIGKNVDTFNQLSRDYAGIMNDVYDKAAANRAAAGNINRQNSSQAFKNIGQIRRDRKQYDRDLIKTEILKPMIEAVYENSDIVIPMLNKQIKKKSTKKSKGE